jgi:D-glycero-alpha-D-manno-heptose-7-phosphate kinase
MSKTPASAIVARAPCRADLAGSTLDLWPLYLFHPGAVTVNFAVTVYASCRIVPLAGARLELRSLDTGRAEAFAGMDELLRAKTFRHPVAALLLRFFRPQQGLMIETHSESPAGAGISGSSALMIATAGALARVTGKKMTLEQLRVLAQNVEAQVIRVPTGCQDYYPALYGGVSAIELACDGIHRNRIDIPAEELESRVVLAYTGAPRQSGINNWEVFKAHIDGERRVLRNFEEIAAIARQMRSAVSRQDWDEVARLLREEWKVRRSNAPGISTPQIDKLIEVAKRNGGRAAKVCGAGGGGCVVFLVEAGARERVARAVAEHGGRLLPSRVSRDGLTFSRKALHITEHGRQGGAATSQAAGGS